ncbi:MAG TPA: Gfo/Idh/MocA family oxidoreductase [Dehalococcoidia bacterium]|nr:Gfo/Idh/MocA family oxidoreductase [Dehalococcoidia bacterium]
MAGPIGIGVIGAGGISHSHLISYTKSRANRELCRVVAIADIDEGRAREQAQTYDIPHVFTDYRDLIAHPEVQAVSVCTPPFLHVEQSCAALRAGKHVLCEKPVSPTLAGLDAIAQAEREGGATFEGVFQHRVGQGAQQVKALIDRGAFGRLVFGLSETLWQRPQEYYDVWWRGTWEQECGGVTMGHGIHSIDMLLWLMGEPESLIADAATVKLDIGVEDTALASVRFRSGALGQIIVTVNAQDNRSRLEIFGTKLQAVSSESPYDPTREAFALTSLDETHAEDARAWAQAQYPETPRHLHGPMVHDFLRAILDSRPPLVGVAECRRSMEAITGLYKSAMTGERVRFPIASDDPFYSCIPAEGHALTPVTRS